MIYWFTGQPGSGNTFLADLLNLRVCRAKVEETTALGSAIMAGLKINTYKSLKDITKK